MVSDGLGDEFLLCLLLWLYVLLAWAWPLARVLSGLRPSTPSLPVLLKNSVGSTHLK